jgi:hypothetical protein
VTVHRDLIIALAAHAKRSQIGHSSICKERGLPCATGRALWQRLVMLTWASLTQVAISCRPALKIEAPAHSIREYFASLRRVQAAIGGNRALHALVSQNAPDELVFAGPVFESDRSRSVAKLMDSDTQPYGRLNPLYDLAAERDLLFVIAGLTREEPILVGAANS